MICWLNGLTQQPCNHNILCCMSSGRDQSLSDQGDQGNKDNGNNFVWIPNWNFGDVLFLCSSNFRTTDQFFPIQVLCCHVNSELSDASHVLNEVGVCFVYPLTINIAGMAVPAALMYAIVVTDARLFATRSGKFLCPFLAHTFTCFCWNDMVSSPFQILLV